MSTPSSPLLDQSQGMMQQATQSLNNSAASPVPQPQGLIDITQHPVIGAIIKAISGAAQSYGWTSMPPQQRMEAQQMEQQKAEAMARLGMQQQQLSFEGQRVGFEGQRTAADVEAQKAAAKRSNVEAEQAPIRTGIERQRANIEKQRADQEYETKKQQLQQEATRVNAEYGPNGLRSKEVGAAVSRAQTDAKLANIADAREKMEKEYKQAEAQRAGLSTDRATLEDERKSRIAAVQEIYGKSPWYEARSTTLTNAQAKIKEINDDIDGRIAQAEKAAGTGMGYSGWKPSQGVTAQPGQGAAPNTAEGWLASKGVKPK